MKFKKICLSTQLSDLYGRDSYQPYIVAGKEYWYSFSSEDEIFKKTGKYWNKIIVTYVRSGVAFYTFIDAPELGEYFFPLSCFMASILVYAEIDPCKDIPKWAEDVADYDGNIPTKLYYFDDEYTIIKNWDNSHEIELTPNDGTLFTIASVMCKIIKE